MITTLVVVIILGLVVTIALSNGPGSPRGASSAGTADGTTTTTGVTSIGSDADKAAVSSCLADYSSIATALSTYKELNNASPPAGTAWAASGGSDALLQAWPGESSYYRLTWNGHTLNVIPRRGTSSVGTSGTSSPPTGCYAA